MIGKLSSTIKSRKYPEVNLVNRYIRSIATQHGFDVAEDGDDDAHPLVNGSARNSTMSETAVTWPVLNRNNSKVTKAPPIISHAEGARADRLVPFLGSAVCDQFSPLRSSDYTMKNVYTPVRVGRWLYGVKVREDKRLSVKTVSSWFKILASNVPNYEVTPTWQYAIDHPVWTYLYGQIFNFAELRVGGWRDEPFQLARVSLYSVYHIFEHTGYPMIRTNQAIDRQKKIDETREGGDRESIYYVHVKDLIATVAVAPVPDNDPTHFGRSQFHFIVLPILL